MRFNWLDVVSLVLVIVGALNWLLVGLFSFNLVTFLFGSIPFLVVAVYTLVGLAGLWLISVLVRASGSAQTA